MSDHLIRRCDTPGCRSEIAAPDDQPVTLATLTAVATVAGWQTLETNTTVADLCPSCVAAAGR
ncbi:hypothetical protein [Streptomyces triticirhizae]|uniref:Uncharacterized protein n=1 Tax=Streptomyces triticirhizae TaxID=2483353 RepID=A0A3M2LQK4_9ACTN|nr:hypothetical protein [Streptomyces triticirhizae]RMI39729.1 hypothetical protein EBN88_14150 [Streptomyces triticirhizae]